MLLTSGCQKLRNVSSSLRNGSWHVVRPVCKPTHRHAILVCVCSVYVCIYAGLSYRRICLVSGSVWMMMNDCTNPFKAGQLHLQRSVSNSTPHHRKHMETCFIRWRRLREPYATFASSIHFTNRALQECEGTTTRCQFPVPNSSEHRANFCIQRCVRVCAATPDWMVMHTTAPRSRSDFRSFQKLYILINRPLFTYNNDV